MDLRDAIGIEYLPRMPRHPEEVTRWILKVQNAIPQLMNIPNGGAAAAQDDEYSQRSGYQDACPADQRSGYQDACPADRRVEYQDARPADRRVEYQDARPADRDVRGDPAVNSTLDYDAYSVVRNEADQCRTRSRGQVGLLSWD